MTLVNLAYALVGYVDPLNTYGGWYEVHSGSKKLPLDRQNLIASLLRSQFLRDTWLWGVVSGVLIFNLLWSGIAAFMPQEGLAEYCAQRQEEGAHHDKVAGIWFFVMSLVFVHDTTSYSLLPHGSQEVQERSVSSVHGEDSNVPSSQDEQLAHS